MLSHVSHLGNTCHNAKSVLAQNTKLANVNVNMFVFRHNFVECLQQKEMSRKNFGHGQSVAKLEPERLQGVQDTFGQHLE